MTALLALHIEAALDPAETDLVRSMSRISISQKMLVLTQGKDIPVLKRALPIFEEILTKKNLHLVGQVPIQASQPRSDNVLDASTEQDAPLPQFGQGDNDSVFLDVNFLGFDFLDEWPMGQMDFDTQQ